MTTATGLLVMPRSTLRRSKHTPLVATISSPLPSGSGSSAASSLMAGPTIAAPWWNRSSPPGTLSSTPATRPAASGSAGSAATARGLYSGAPRSPVATSWAWSGADLRSRRTRRSALAPDLRDRDRPQSAAQPYPSPSVHRRLAHPFQSIPRGLGCTRGRAYAIFRGLPPPTPLFDLRHQRYVVHVHVLLGFSSIPTTPPARSRPWLSGRRWTVDRVVAGTGDRRHAADQHRPRGPAPPDAAPLAPPFWQRHALFHAQRPLDEHP